jgi:hypothetical protein
MVVWVSVKLICGAMRDVAYIVLTAALAKSSIAFSVLDLVVKAHTTKVASKAKKNMRHHCAIPR